MIESSTYVCSSTQRRRSSGLPGRLCSEPTVIGTTCHFANRGNGFAWLRRASLTSAEVLLYINEVWYSALCDPGSELDCRAPSKSSLDTGPLMDRSVDDNTTSFELVSKSKCIVKIPSCSGTSGEVDVGYHLHVPALTLLFIYFSYPSRSVPDNRIDAGRF